MGRTLSAAEPPPTCVDLVKAATADSGSSYGGIVVDAATETSMGSILGKPLSARNRSCVWIGTEGCRGLGLKMVRAKYAENGVLSQMTLDLREPILRAEVLGRLRLGQPVHTHEANGVTIELYLPANLALGVSGDRVIRLYLFGSHTPGMRVEPTADLSSSGLAGMDAAPIPDTQEGKDEALRKAVQLGDAGRMSRLLAAGADAMSTDGRGWTALHHAAYLGHAEIISRLVVSSARPTSAGSEDVDLSENPLAPLLNKCSADGETALQLACAHRRSAAAKVLLRMGADPDAASGDGRPALHLAVLAGNSDLVEMLLLSGANVYQRTSRGYTPLDLATNEDIRRVLSQVAARAGADPAEDEARDVVKEFLDATRRGDAVRMKALVVSSVREKLPAQDVVAGDFDWEISGVGFESGVAEVRCALAFSKGPGGLERVSKIFRLRCSEGAWQIVAMEAGPKVP